MPENIPQVIPTPQSRDSLKAGFDQMTKLLAQTLGPTQGLVFSSTALKPTPEPLTDAATIARRMVALPDRSEDMGAMLLRSLAWRVHERVGDGAATTAVLAQAILEQASRMVAAGGNPVRVQAGIQKATRHALSTLQTLASPVTCQEQLTAVACSATGETEISFLLGEMFDLMGEHAHVTIENYMAPYLEREYIDGGRWEAKLISPHLISAPLSGKAQARDCHVVLFNGNLSRAEDVLPLIKLLSQQEQKNLLLVAHKISGEAASTLVATYVQNKSRLEFVLVELMRAGEKALNDLQDLAVLTNARLFDPQAGDLLTRIQPADLGRARRAEANNEELRVSGGQGDAQALKQQIDTLAAHLGRLPFDDNQIPELKMRLGRLSGHSGILKVGAYTQKERDVLHQKAKQGLQAVEAARQAGFLPGGGTAYLHCITAIESMDCSDDDERMGYRVMARALRRPFEQLLANVGEQNPARWAHEITSVPPGLFFDTRQHKIRPALEAGVLDATQTLMACLETASSGAQMALSTDVLILKRKPRVTYQPG